LLRNGKVLFTGGDYINFAGHYITPQAELYGSTNAPTKSFSQVHLDRATDASTLISFASTPNGTNSILVSSDCMLPKISWTNVGRAIEISPGLYSFVESPTTNFPQRFYSIRSP